MMNNIEPVSCKDGAIPMTGKAAFPENPTNAPVVLVFPGASGGERRMRQTILTLANAGYIGVAANIYDARENIADIMVAGRQYAGLVKDPATLRNRTRAWASMARGLAGADPDRLAAIGFCFGGQCALELARSGENLRAAISFHGLLSTSSPAKKGTIHGLIAAWCAGQDYFAPAGDIGNFKAEMDAAGANYQICVFSHARHGFTDPDASQFDNEHIVYDALADEVSWAGATALLKHAFATPVTAG